MFSVSLPNLAEKHFAVIFPTSAAFLFRFPSVGFCRHSRLPLRGFFILLSPSSRIIVSDTSSVESIFALLKALPKASACLLGETLSCPSPTATKGMALFSFSCCHPRDSLPGNHPLFKNHLDSASFTQPRHTVALEEAVFTDTISRLPLSATSARVRSRNLIF